MAIAWYDTRDGHPEIYARVVDTRGVPAGPEIRLNEFTPGPDGAHDSSGRSEVYSVFVEP